MKIIKPKDLPVAVLAAGIALFKKYKRKGVQRTVEYDGTTIIIEPARDRVVFLGAYTPFVHILNNRAHNAQIYSRGVTGYLMYMPSTPFDADEPPPAPVTEEEEWARVAPVGLQIGQDPIFATSDITVRGSGMPLVTVRKLLYAQSRFEALVELDYDDTFYVYIKPGSVLYNRGIRRARCELSNIVYRPYTPPEVHSFFFTGTDAQNEPVFIVRVLNTWLDSSEVVHTHPGHGHAAGDPLESAEAYTEHYVIIPFSKMVVSPNPYTVPGNDADTPNTTVQVVLGGTTHSFVVTQDNLQEMLDIGYAILHQGPLEPQHPDDNVNIYALAIDPIRTDEDTGVLVTARISISVSTLGMSYSRQDAFDVVYMPDKVPEAPHRFGTTGAQIYDSTRAIHAHSDEWAYPTPDSSVHTWGVDMFVIARNVQFLSYALSEQAMREDASSTRTSDGSGGWYTYETKTSSSEVVKAAAYNITYETGEFKVEAVANTAFARSSFSGGFTYDKDNSGDTSTESHAFSATTSVTAEPLHYDGYTYTYDGVFAAPQNITYEHTKILSDTLPPSYVGSTTGLVINRGLRSWWHQPVLSTSTQYVRLVLRMLTRMEGLLMPVHAHIIRDDNTSAQQHLVYVNGQRVGTRVQDSPLYGTPQECAGYMYEYPAQLSFIQQSSNAVSDRYGNTSQPTLGYTYDQTTYAGGTVSYYAGMSVYMAVTTTLPPYADINWREAQPFNYVYNRGPDVPTEGDEYYQTVSPVARYKGEWVGGDPEFDDGKYIMSNDLAVGNPTHEGHYLFPSVVATPEVRVIHYVGATANSDGLCIYLKGPTSDSLLAEYEALIVDADAPEGEALRVLKELADSFDVMYNNFASVRLMVAFMGTTSTGVSRIYKKGGFHVNT